MQVILYSNFSKRKNSTKNPDVVGVQGVTKNLVLKNKCSRIRPSFFIADETPYVYLKAWGWFYFVTNIAYDIDGAQYIECELDVLGTWRNNIFNTSTFVRFSSSNYDVNVIDDRVAQKVTNNYDIAVQESDVFNKTEYTYILSTINEYGPTSYAMDYGTLSAVLRTIMADDSIWDSIKDVFGDVSSGLLSLYVVPIPLRSITGGFDIVKIGKEIISGTSGNISAIHTHGIVQEEKNIDIPWRYGDFRRCGEYTRFILTLPFIGCVDISPEKLIGYTQLTIKVACNVITGQLTYRLSVGGNYIATYAGAFGRELPVSTSQKDVQGFLSGISSQSAAALSGGIATGLGAAMTAVNPVGGAMLTAGAVKSAYSLAQGALQTTAALHKADFTHVGGFGGGFSEHLISQYQLVSISFDSRTDPSELTTLYGRPCYKVVQISSLSGYVQTMGFSIEISAPDVIRVAINEAMDNGVYLE